MNTLYLFIGAPEIFVIMLIVIMVFGADKIPDIARGLGKGMRQVKDATNDIKKEINDTSKEHNIDNSIVKDINSEINGVKEGIDEFTGPIKRNR